MISRLNLRTCLIAAILLSVTGSVIGENVYYENDFESGTFLMDTPNPVWFTKNPADAFGSGNLFDMSTSTSHSGQYSLRFDYAGRNGFCNICGSTATYQQSGYDSVGYFIDEAGNDLVTDPFLAAPERIVYNRTNRFSKWRIDSINNQNNINDKLTMTLLNDGIGDVTGQFNSGDLTLITRVCGVDGLIGGNIDRRSDCDQAIYWFIGDTQQYGESIFRRVYLKPDIKVPPYHQKLNYWRPEGGGEIVLFAETDLGDSTSIHAMLHGLKEYGAPIDNYLPNITFKSGVWYYIEQEYEAQSGPGIYDGAYRLWLYESDKESSIPILEVTNLALPPVGDTSFWGNHQHETDSYGSWFIDDIKISNSKIGPTSNTGGDIAPPMPPVVN